MPEVRRDAIDEQREIVLEGARTLSVTASSLMAESRAQREAVAALLIELRVARDERAGLRAEWRSAAPGN